ncbi:MULTISPECIES: RimK family protein [Pseudoalteromonas]|uniref:Carboxylate--amine ligase n=1 Tax=Pseudoalteromonas amylolytica TaxID=1859457 RepID=A0A1S1MLM7_9GAMM|nr:MULTISPECIES: RimK family protein [Pseudoalteromonas]MCF6436270.1 RimK family protein [Pseudoalteromonas sp. MMG022]OHU86803.1 carboxylate--amine ligase [Pseudoalteromonas sp. JW3]OHU88672.1 carboxylate--amine ligase [Pseudoalteromonas amylolytica]
MLKTLIVVESEQTAAEFGLANVLSFEQYLQDYPKRDEPKTRIINLCDTGQYLSKGYYCSLLAEARKHVVLPTVKTINALRTEHLDFSLTAAQRKALEQKPQWVFFGQTDVVALEVVAATLYKRFAAPLLCIRLMTENRLIVEQGSITQLDEAQKSYLFSAMAKLSESVWRLGNKQQHARWEMAILVDPQEPSPPSDDDAIAKFVKAARKNGIHAQVKTIHTLDDINQYDALFIRQTTAIDHVTYRLASKAEGAGVVVMDDATSILRCCNKVYLHDAFSYNKVPTLKTQVVSDASEHTLMQLEQLFSYPMVLKMPEGSFSRGVYKVKERQQLIERLEELLAESALVLVQEYLYTDFDWRIGVLNGRAIYACRYHMARNHWQIYNHDSKRFSSGGFETLPTFEVPRAVLSAALKACKVIGNGLYGVDIKEVNGKAYVIEVNDNPSIDHKVEDAYLGNELYMLIMAEFVRRLEARGKYE